MTVSGLCRKKQRQSVHKAEAIRKRDAVRDEIIAAMRKENSLPRYRGVMVFLELDIPVAFEITELVSERLRLAPSRKLEAFKAAASRYQGAFFGRDSDRQLRLRLFAETLVASALAAAGYEDSESARLMERFRKFCGSFRGNVSDFSPEEALFGKTSDEGGLSGPGLRICGGS